MRVTSSAKAFFEVVDVLIQGFSRGVSSQKSKGFMGAAEDSCMNSKYKSVYGSRTTGLAYGIRRNETKRNEYCNL